KRVLFASAESPVLLQEAVSFLHVSPPSHYGLPSELNLYRFQRHFVRRLAAFEKCWGGIVYQRMSVANYAGVVLSRRWRAPLVLEYNGSEAWVARNWGTPLKFEALAVEAEEMCLKHAHLVVTVSEVLRDELLQRGIEAERIVVY